MSAEQETPSPPKPLALIEPDRSEAVRRADIAAIGSKRTAKNLATNQGVKGYVDDKVSKSELATAHAMAEVFAQLDTSVKELRQEVEVLREAFEKVVRAQQSQILRAFGRIAPLEERWWERLTRDLEWDLYPLRDFFMGLFNWTDEIPSELDSDIVDIQPFLAQLESTEESTQDEWAVCCCGHTAEQHTFSQPGPCAEDDCECNGYVAVGSTLPPEGTVPL